MSDIFISYSCYDSDVVNELVTLLEREGYSVWIDRDGIESGEDFKEKIARAIKESSVVLFFSSEHSNVSDWTAKEIGVAVKYKKHIIPIMLDDSNFNEAVEFDLINHDYIDYSKPTIRPAMREKLLKTLRNKLGPRSTDSERLEAERKAKEAEEMERQEKERLAKEARFKTELEREEQERLVRERVEAERKAREEAERKLTFTVNGVSFDMIKVEGGKFWMGADDGRRTRTVTKKGFFRDRQEQEAYVNRCVRNFDEEASHSESPVHSVTVSTFYMGETEVTQALWKAVMGSNPSHWQGDNLPVEKVSWNDCQGFIRKLNSLTGRNFRLPTEAEWEYAARGGNQSSGCKYSGSSNIGRVAWYTDNSGDKTHAVKGKSPNELNLYDMSGNVFEWCGDWYDDYGSSSQTNPEGPSRGYRRVLRGGDWRSQARVCRVSYRIHYDPAHRFDSYGLRLAIP